MVINLNNSFINSFTKGMNSDGAYDQLDGALYVFGQNIRTTKNQFLGGKNDYASVHEGVITPIPEGIRSIVSDNNIGTILAVKSIDNMAVIISTVGDNIRVYRFYMNNTTNSIEPGTFTLLWDSGHIWNSAPKQVSAVLYKELENVIKLYIADGVHPIISLRVDEQGSLKLSSVVNGNTVYTNVDSLINNRIVPTERIYIQDVISGRLTTGQVQYTYRYYNKYGNTTLLAPLTNKIQVIDSSRTKEIGNAEDTETSIGFQIKININAYKDIYERLQVYRLLYIKAGADAEVYLIYDGQIKETTPDNFILNDVGIEPLQQLSMEEFSAMSGVILIPQVIELNQEYMFCGNVIDDTILRIKPIVQDNIIQEVTTSVILSEDLYGDIPNEGNHLYTPLDSITNELSVPLYFKLRGINPEIAKPTYNNIFTSSLLRSLRRGETYKYGIVYYDKYGRRTDVIDLGKKDISSMTDSPSFIKDTDGVLKAKPIGVKIQLPQFDYNTDIEAKDIIGCQIIRRSSSDIYQKTLLLCALSRPVLQGMLNFNLDIPENQSYNEYMLEHPDIFNELSIKKSPFYPTGLLTTNAVAIKPSFYSVAEDVETMWARVRNTKLYLIFSSEIDFRRDDVLSRLNISDTEIKEVLYIYSAYAKYDGGSKVLTYDGINPPSILHPASGNPYSLINRNNVEKLTIDKKLTTHWIFNFYNISPTGSGFEPKEINQIKDVKIADWNSGFDQILKGEGNGDLISTAIKKYKSFSTSIDKFSYNNWVSFGKYDFRPGYQDEVGLNFGYWYTAEFISLYENYKQWLNEDDVYSAKRNGFIGPGPSCFLISTKENTGDFDIPNARFYTSVCNITHSPKLEDVESDEFVSYYGFGDYFNLKYNQNNNRLETIEGSTDLVVFDGDIYITPHEFTTLYKTYNFESVDTLQSTQITNYIPLESKVNTYFDYGMNLRNTNSENLLYEPGSIDSITTQERPIHQYNMIYSDNDASNDVFTLISTDENETNNFKLRTYYSELKNNGEFIDNFLIFKAAAFIDVDSKYGQITNLLTDKNQLYYWQDVACGKFSVNERSLINDLNSNTIMLGLAGILSRYDYITTKYGMREQDFSAISSEAGVFWIDINNKAIVALQQGVINYGEHLNVQNIINDKISEDTPKINYDLQNNELLCKCLKDGELFVFNIKFNIATSVYTRDYDYILDIQNHQYGLKIDGSLYSTKYNYLPYRRYNYLKPSVLEFIVNPSASVTKVFDSQQIVPIKRILFKETYSVDKTYTLDNVTMAFETDIVNKTYGKDMEPYTDREGNIIYSVPRYMNEPYGNRIRGKWLKVNMLDDNPSEYSTISHVITKFRQSFS